MRFHLSGILLFLSLFGISQGFNRQYYLANSASSSCTDAFEAPGGNIILTGVITDTFTGASKLCIVGTDPTGQLLWQKEYGRTTFQYLENNFISRSVITDANFFYLYTALVDSNSKYFSALLKFNYNGDTLWQKKYYDATDHLYIQGITKSVDNGFLMTGFFEGTLETCLLIKTDISGNELWRKKIQKGTGINTQAGHKLIQDSATKKIVIAGYQYEADGTQPGNFSGYANILVTDSVGVVQYKTVFSGNCGSGFRDLIQTRDKKCIAIGYNDQCNNLGGPLGERRNKAFAVKFDLNNLTPAIWEKQFDTLSVLNHFMAITELNNEDILLAGTLDTLNNYNMWDNPMTRLIKLDKHGTVKWKKCLERDNVYTNTKFVMSINKTVNGGFLLANQLLYLPGKKPFSFIKIDSNGCDSTAAHCATLNLVGIQKENSPDTGISLYPNPVKDLLIIEIETNRLSELFLNDISGQELKHVYLSSNSKIDLNDLSSGMYLVTITQNKKVVYKTKIIKEN